MSRTTITALIVITALGLVALTIMYADRYAVSEMVADRQSDGRCFLCRRTLVVGEQVSNLVDEPGLGLAHIACLRAAYGPENEIEVA